jgi:hypothetical protein
MQYRAFPVDRAGGYLAIDIEADDDRAAVKAVAIAGREVALWQENRHVATVSVQKSAA